MKRLITTALLTLICAAAFAQPTGGDILPPAVKPQVLAPYVGPTPCLPAFPSSSESPADWVQPAWNTAWIGTPLRLGYSRNGQWAKWHCAEVGTGRLVTVTYAGTLTDLVNIGGRLRTIINAADPLKSLQTLGSRITLLPLTDPSLAAVVAEIPK